MRLYYGKKILFSVRIPLAWKKALVTKARKEKMTLSDVIGGWLERKFGLGKGKVYKPKRDTYNESNKKEV
jgi:hypothetical protein